MVSLLTGLTAGPLLGVVAQRLRELSLLHLDEFCFCLFCMLGCTKKQFNWPIWLENKVIRFAYVFVKNKLDFAWRSGQPATSWHHLAASQLLVMVATRFAPHYRQMWLHIVHSLVCSSPLCWFLGRTVTLCLHTTQCSTTASLVNPIICLTEFIILFIVISSIGRCLTLLLQMSGLGLLKELK